MIYKTLIKGWVLPILIVLLWLLAILASYVVEEDNLTLIIFFIVSANCFLYLSVANRLMLLVHSSMSVILPDYFTQLKKSLMIILLVSFIPTLILIPNFMVWFAVLSVLIFMAVLFIAMSYQPKFYLVFAISVFMPLLADNFPSFFAELNFQLLLAWSLPAIAGGAYHLLNNLDHYKGKAAHVKKVMALTNSSYKSTVASQEEVPLKSRNRFMQWLINSNFDHYLTLIRSTKTMSNTQRLSIVCHSVSSIGRTTYLCWGVGVILFSLLASYFEQEKQEIFVVMMLIFPASLILGGTVNSFIVINNKKSLLKRLSILPCFNKKHSFSLAFITYIITNQLKLYVFILLVVAMLAYTFHHLTLSMYMNILFVSLTLYLLNLTLLFWTWSSKLQFDNLVIWLIITTFIACMALLIGADINHLLVWKSTIFNAFALICLSLFSVSLYRSYHYGFKEL